MPVCSCTLHLYRYRTCRHYSNPVKHECWRADWREMGACFAGMFPCGKPTKVRHSREGLCKDCDIYFAQFGNLSKQVLESFLMYKESRGWQKKRVNPNAIASEKFIHPNILKTLESTTRPQPFQPHAPMKMGSTRGNSNGDYPQPPPPVHHTKSARRQPTKKYRAPTPHEPFLKPISEVGSFDLAAEGGLPSDYAASVATPGPEYVEIPLTPTGGDVIPLHDIPIPRPHSVEESPLVRRITEEAERLFPNPESPGYPGVPKLSAPPKHRQGRRLPRGAKEPAEDPTVIPAVIVNLPELAHNVVSPIAQPTPATSPTAALRRVQAKSPLFAPAADESPLVRALSLETLSEQQTGKPSQGAEHGNRQRKRSQSVAVPSSERASGFHGTQVEGGWM